MNIYQDFPPTFLYIKQHSITKKLYFGKTTLDPEKYTGSGVHWRSHIKYHGKQHIETLWYCLYLDKETIKEAALLFSRLWDIVESKDWLNLIVEDGLSGGDTISNHPNIKEIKKKISNKSSKCFWWNNGTEQCFSHNPPDMSYNKGRLQFNNIGAQIGANIQKQKHWINNSVVEYMIKKTLPIPKGYMKGRLKSKAFGGDNRISIKGVKWWNNKIKEIMCHIPPDNTFTPGRLKHYFKDN